MAFESLWKAAQDGELMLIDDGMCHWHLRRDGQLTIAEIISLKPGTGQVMLNVLMGMNEVGATCIVAKCPVDLESNKWYAKRGFKKVALEYSKTGRAINVWKMELPPYVTPTGRELPSSNGQSDTDISRGTGQQGLQPKRDSADQVTRRDGDDTRVEETTTALPEDDYNR